MKQKMNNGQMKQKMNNEMYEIRLRSTKISIGVNLHCLRRNRDVVEQAQVISENVLAAETYLREKFPHAETGTQGTDLNAQSAGTMKCARPSRSENADEVAYAADRAELSCDPKERGKGKIKVRLQEKGR